MITPLFIGAAFVPQNPQGQAPPVFRGGIELRQLDVTVRDKQRRPVRGLAAADFTVTEDNVPQKIEAFSFVDLPDRVSEGPVWANTAESDVMTNQLDSARTFVIVIDDVKGAGDLWAQRELKKSVANFVSQLGADDVAAVVFPGGTYPSQNFTRDHAKLVAAVQPLGTTNVGILGACEPDRRLPESLRYMAQSMGGLPGGRKAIVYFGGTLSIPKDAVDECGAHQLWVDLFLEAQQQHVSIYPIDTMGLRVGAGGQRVVDDYITVANETGGRALINNNSFEEGIARIFAENDSYYLLAYAPTNAIADGRFRRVAVKVNRPGLEVTATRSYWAPKDPAASKKPVATPAPELEAMAGAKPISKLPLRAVAAPFAVAGSQSSVATIALSVAQPGFPSRTSEEVELVLKTFASEGVEQGTDRQTIGLAVPAVRTDGGESRYEVLARIDIPKPGSYEVRVSVHSAATDALGSIFVDVDVPDFARAPVSLSGVVLSSALPAFPVAPARLLRDVIPVVPTTQRTFTATDAITAFLRVYQGVTDPLVAAPLRIQIQNGAGTRVFDRTETLARDRFNASRAWPAGDYLLSFETMVGKVSARRDIKFRLN